MCWTAMSTIFLTGQAPTELLLYFSACLYPIGGVFNFLVYTRPEVSKLRIRYPDEYSYLQALLLVIKAGGVTLVTSWASPGNPITSDKKYGTGEAFHAQEVEQKQIQSSSLSSGGMMLRNLSSIDTPPVILGNVLSSGDYSEEPDDCDRIVERKKYTYYTRKFVGLSDSSPSRSPLANALSPATDESSNSTSAGEGEQSNLSLFSGMETIAEEPDEEE
jgi:hypothetical protein